MTDTKTKKTSLPHWYKICYRICVLCGTTSEWRERVYGEKPKREWERYDGREFACDQHFF